MQIYSNVNLHKYKFTPTVAKPWAHTSILEWWNQYVLLGLDGKTNILISKLF